MYQIIQLYVASLCWDLSQRRHKIGDFERLGPFIRILVIIHVTER
jgi:hypothetical protein